jgi:hypothetical protein
VIHIGEEPKPASKLIVIESALIRKLTEFMEEVTPRIFEGLPPKELCTVLGQREGKIPARERTIGSAIKYGYEPASGDICLRTTLYL